MSRRLKRHRWLIPGLIIVLAAASFVTWGTIVPAPMAQALSALESDAQVLHRRSRVNVNAEVIEDQLSSLIDLLPAYEPPRQARGRPPQHDVFCYAEIGD